MRTGWIPTMKRSYQLANLLNKRTEKNLDPLRSQAKRPQSARKQTRQGKAQDRRKRKRKKRNQLVK